MKSTEEALDKIKQAVKQIPSTFPYPRDRLCSYDMDLGSMTTDPKPN